MKRAMLALLLAGFVYGAESPDEIRERGFVALKAAQAEPERIVEAAKLLAEASEAFLAAGNEKEAQETESYLFWAKKKMTIQQIDAFVARDGAQAKKVIERLEAVEKKTVPTFEAEEWLAKADRYASVSADQFLIAVRYFEVASRFSDTPEGRSAMEKSLAALQKVKAAPAPAKPVVVAVAAKGMFEGRWVMKAMPYRDPKLGRVPNYADMVFTKQGDTYQIAEVNDTWRSMIVATPVAVNASTFAFRWSEQQALVVTFTNAMEAQFTVYMNVSNLRRPNGQIWWQGTFVRSK